MSSKGLFAIIMVPAALGVVAFFLWGVLIKPQFIPDIFKLTYQFLLLVVIGGGVSWFLTEHSKEKEKSAAGKILLRERYLNFIQSYNGAKKVRRLLRAKARSLSPNEAIMIAPYDEQMQVLIDIQLQFETFISEVKGNPTLFSGSSDTGQLTIHLKKIEDYLNDIIGEYEELYKKNPSNTPTLPITTLTRLEEFIREHKQAIIFQAKFQDPAHEVMNALRRKLLTS